MAFPAEIFEKIILPYEEVQKDVYKQIVEYIQVDNPSGKESSHDDLSPDESSSGGLLAETV